MTGLGDVSFLFVDKNEHMVAIVVTICRRFGARKISKAQGLAKALKFILEHNVESAICDIKDGLKIISDMTRYIRAIMDMTKRSSPIALLTSATTVDRIEAARDSGITNVCCKPVSARDLFLHIASIVDNLKPL